MIIVDIYVPSVDKTYDFKLDENQHICVLLDEIIEMIRQKEQSYTLGQGKDAILAEKHSRRILDINNTLKNAGIHTGDMLILV